MKRRFLSMMLALIMVFSLIPGITAVASAADRYIRYGYNYSDDTDNKDRVEIFADQVYNDGVQFDCFIGSDCKPNTNMISYNCGDYDVAADEMYFIISENPSVAKYNGNNVEISAGRKTYWFTDAYTIETSTGKYLSYDENRNIFFSDTDLGIAWFLSGNRICTFCNFRVNRDKINSYLSDGELFIMYDSETGGFRADFDNGNPINFANYYPVTCSHPDIEMIPESEGSCTEPGNTLYYSCPNCGKLYSDKNGDVEIYNPESVILPAKGHIDLDGNLICDNCDEELPNLYFRKAASQDDIHIGGKYILVSGENDVLIPRPEKYMYTEITPMQRMTPKEDGTFNYYSVSADGGYIFTLSPCAYGEFEGCLSISNDIWMLDASDGCFWWTYSDPRGSKYGYDIRLKEDGTISILENYDVVWGQIQSPDLTEEEKVYLRSLWEFSCFKNNEDGTFLTFARNCWLPGEEFDEKEIPLYLYVLEGEEGGGDDEQGLVIDVTAGEPGSGNEIPKDYEYIDKEAGCVIIISYIERNGDGKWVTPSDEVFLGGHTYGIKFMVVSRGNPLTPPVSAEVNGNKADTFVMNENNMTGEGTYEFDTLSPEDEPHVHQFEYTPSEDDEETHIGKCTCGFTITEEHVFDKGNLIKEPSLDGEGLVIYTCEKCRYSYGESIPYKDINEEGETVSIQVQTPYAGEKIDPKESFYSDPLYMTDISYMWVEKDSFGEEIDLTDEVFTQGHTYGIKFDINKSLEGMTFSLPLTVLVNGKTAEEVNIDDELLSVQGKYFFDTLEDGSKDHEHEYEYTPSAAFNGHIAKCECGDSFNEDHTFGEGDITKEPSHTEEGEITFICEKCGFEKKDPIEKTSDHEFGDWQPSAAFDGHVRYCECGEYEQEAHDFAWIIVNEATDKEDGLRKGICTVCLMEKEEAILIPKIAFADIKPNQYYFTPVAWAVQNKITNGMSENEFAPNEYCTRGQIVTFLWRAAGKPEPQNSTNEFIDVKETAFYYKAVLWAVEKGITNGISQKAFGPNLICTRAQTVTFIWRANGCPEPECLNSPFKDIANPFKDINESDYYYKAVLWAVENEVTKGISDTEFGPSQMCTRGQIVTFLYRDDTNMNKIRYDSSKIGVHI